ncbi:MAG: hypothetical protein HFJ87_04575 [Muribaculaceae bacterium]|nr:hypothetical protein [Muribaculaceae bacterium]
MKPSTKKVVEHIVDNYRKAGKAMGRTEERNGQLASWMTKDTFDDTADKIQGAYDAGDFDNVPESEVDALMDKYGASDIYHLTASYFNATGKILNIE